MQGVRLVLYGTICYERLGRVRRGALANSSPRAVARGTGQRRKFGKGRGRAEEGRGAGGISMCVNESRLMAQLVT